MHKKIIMLSKLTDKKFLLHNEPNTWREKIKRNNLVLQHTRGGGTFSSVTPNVSC